MNTYLMTLLAAAMIVTGASAFASEAAQEASASASSSSTRLEVEELKPAIDETPAAKPVKHYKRSTSSKQRAKDLDFRHCLDLKDNAAIAQCAQEQ